MFESGNAIQDVNQNSRKMSSYALLCNENIMEWTNGVPLEDRSSTSTNLADLELGSLAG